jgi:hypothetical protein
MIGQSLVRRRPRSESEDRDASQPPILNGLNFMLDRPMGTDTRHSGAGVQEFASTGAQCPLRMILGGVGFSSLESLVEGQNPATKSNATMEAPKPKS